MQAASHGGTPLAECFSGMDVSHKRAVFSRRSGLSVCAGSSVSIGLSCALFRCLKGRTMSWGCHRLASQSGFAFPDRALRFSLSQSWEGNPPRMPLRSDWNFSSAGLINNPEGPCNNVSILWQRCLPRQQMSGPIIPRLVGLRSESPAYPGVYTAGLKSCFEFAESDRNPFYSRASRIRCDGQSACSNCIAKGHTCVYIPSRRGGPRYSRKVANAVDSFDGKGESGRGLEERKSSNSDEDGMVGVYAGSGYHINSSPCL